MVIRHRLAHRRAVVDVGAAVLARELRIFLQAGDAALHSFVIQITKSIDAFATYLRRLMPEVRFAVAHGQMAEGDEEDGGTGDDVARPVEGLDRVCPDLRAGVCARDPGELVDEPVRPREEMQGLGAADVAVSRAGASSMAELAAMRLPSVLKATLHTTSV